MSVIVIGTNFLSSVGAQESANMRGLFYHLGKYSKHDVYDITPTRFSVDKYRNLVAKTALDVKADYILWIDDDMLVPLTVPTFLDQLIETDYDIIMAHSFIRGYPFHPMCFKDVNPNKEQRFPYYVHYDDVMKDAKENGVTDVGAVGFTCTLIKVDLLKELQPPYFVTAPTHTEDVYFCIRCALEIEREVKIGVHTKIQTHHRLDPIFVSENNVEALRTYFETMIPGLKEKSEQDRGTAYHRAMQEIKENQHNLTKES